MYSMNSLRTLNQYIQGYRTEKCHWCFHYVLFLPAPATVSFATPRKINFIQTKFDHESP